MQFCNMVLKADLRGITVTAKPVPKRSFVKASDIVVSSAWRAVLYKSCGDPLDSRTVLRGDIVFQQRTVAIGQSRPAAPPPVTRQIAPAPPRGGEGHIRCDPCQRGPSIVPEGHIAPRIAGLRRAAAARAEGISARFSALELPIRYLGRIAGPAQTAQPFENLGGPDTIRTCDLRLRRATLYPAELRVQLVCSHSAEHPTTPASPAALNVVSWHLRLAVAL